jgi:hypothetical protein
VPVSDAELKLAEQLIDHLAAKRFAPMNIAMNLRVALKRRFNER